jgi:prevent-host-death family protein
MTIDISEVFMKVPAGQFKAKCLQLMDKVQKSHEEVIITKFGKPVCKLVPVNSSEQPSQAIFGYMNGTAETIGDIISPIGETWLAEE